MHDDSTPSAPASTAPRDTGSAPDPTLPEPRHWIDLLLLAGGGALLVAGLPELGVPILALGLLVPMLVWRARCAGGIDRLLLLVPGELAIARSSVIDAAVLPGTIDPDEVIGVADELVLEVAAVLGGRPARRASQRRYVEVRTAALETVAEELRERHDAWRAAMDELDVLAPVEEAEHDRVGESSGPGWLSFAFLIVLAPIFVVVDVGRGAGRAMVALADGIALRLRTVLEVVLASGRAMARGIRAAFRQWRRATAAIVGSARTARLRFVAARALWRRRLRRRVVRRPLG